ncbi:MAG TPA: uroporphyrinogen-III synthase [Terriglobales bacterium]|jgi:uroporphyrinogen-III synthase|nr:uroporphyrinogen-III synthase [Terriglobales bacterium]
MNTKEELATRPLAGKRVLVGRARHQASALSAALRLLGAEVIEIPLIEIREPASWRPLDQAIARLLDYDWLILTSVNGVQALFARLGKVGKTEADLLHLNIAAIGPATSKAIENHGLPVDVMPEEYVAEAVVAELKQEVKSKRVLLVRAKIARDVIPNELAKAGAKVDVVEAYETVAPESSRSELTKVLRDPRRKPDVITFTSSSTVRNFLELLGKNNQALLTGTKLASIGPITSQTMRELGLHVDIEAREYTVPGLVATIATSI